MYKNILIATDGSSLAARAVEHGTNLAKSLGAEVLLLTVTERFHVFALEADQLEETPVSFSEHMQKQAERTLSEASEIARNLGVEATTLHMEDDAPYQAIIRMAEDHVCDLIVMASHGRGGVSALLLGSETMKVLAPLEHPGPGRAVRNRILALDGIQVGEQVVDLSGIELELGHGRMARRDAFRKGLREILDRIAGVQGPEGRRFRNGAVADAADGMALGAVRLREREPALHPSRLGHGDRRGACEDKADESEPPHHRCSPAKPGSAGVTATTWNV